MLLGNVSLTPFPFWLDMETFELLAARKNH